MRDTVRAKGRDTDEDGIISRDEREWTTRVRLTRTVNEEEMSEKERRKQSRGRGGMDEARERGRRREEVNTVEHAGVK